MKAAAQSMLLCRSDDRLCALPLENVTEAMRPLPLAPIKDAPPFVSGVAIIRGIPVPVVDIRVLLGRPPALPGRFVTVKAGAQIVALAVDEVIGIRQIPAECASDMPSLLQHTDMSAVQSLGVLDQELFVVLNSSMVIPKSVWEQLESLDAGKVPH